MTSVLDKLNLSPQERRLVVGVSIIVFVVLNFWLVWPYFGRLGEVQQRTHDAREQLKKYNTEIQKAPVYEKQAKELENRDNYIPTEEQATSLTKEVSQQAALSGVIVQSSVIMPSGRHAAGRTNTFFEEQALQLTFQNTGEKELVDFLFSLGAQNTLIRVKNMNIRPELPSRMKLAGQLTLVKSYQRKPPPKAPARPAAAPAAEGSKPTPPARTGASTPPKQSSPPPAPPPARQAPQQIPSPTTKTNPLATPLRPANK